MPCSDKKPHGATSLSAEPCCNSPYSALLTGCCANGKACDEICIAIAAAQECRDAHHEREHEDENLHNSDDVADNATQQAIGCKTACCSTTETPTNRSDRVKRRWTEDVENGSCCGDTDNDTKDGKDSKKSGCCETVQPECCTTDERVPKGCGSEIKKQCKKTTCCEPVVLEPETKVETNHNGMLTEDRTGTSYCKATGTGVGKGFGSKNDLAQYGCAASMKEGCATMTAKNCSDKEESCSSSKAPAEVSDSCCKSQAIVTLKQNATSESCCGDSVSSSSSLQKPIINEFQEACSTHLEQAIRKYTSYLETGLCVCRNALSHIDNCCDQNKRAALAERRKLANSNAASTAHSTSKRCKNNQGIAISKGCCEVNQACCLVERKCSGGKMKSSVQTVECMDGHITTDKNGCCEKRWATPSNQECPHEGKNTFQKRAQTNSEAEDIERTAAREHVSFSIMGMTCTGCVKKITGVLGRIDGVSDVRVNFVAATGDLDVDSSKTAAEATLQQLEKETGFKCVRIIGHYQTLDLLMSHSDAELLSNQACHGIASIKRTGKIYRISYNPLLIGAREVVARSAGVLAPLSNDSAVAEGRRRFLIKVWAFLVAAVLTIPVVVLAWADTPVAYSTSSITSLVLATFVQAIAVPEFYLPALKALIFSKAIEMDMLVVISITAAYGYSIVAFGLTHAGFELEQGEFFETSTLLITLVLLGRLVSSYAKVKAVQVISMRSLQAETAYLENGNGTSQKIDARLLELNDVIRIPPYSNIVSDGQVIGGESAVDESMLTGESLPVPKATGNAVIAGTRNGSGMLTVRLTRLPGQNSITDIANLVQDALAAKPRIQDLADVVAGYFVPVVIAISIIVLVIWIVVALRIRELNAGGAVGLSMTYGIAVLAISCPCALGLAVPLVLVIAGGVAAKRGVIIKQADATERGFRVTDVVFDKTGTLTKGDLEVVGEVKHDNGLSEAEAFSLVLGLVKDNEHPVSQAVARSIQVRDSKLQASVVQAVRSVPGSGVEATYNGAFVKAGNPYWLNMSSEPSVAALLAEGRTLLCITSNSRLLMSFSLQAALRAEAASVVANLNVRGITCHVVSGDQPSAVAQVANAVRIAPENVVSRQTPAEKQAYVQNLISSGRTTLFVGDGTNDAVAIAQANVGVQVGSTSDVTRATADVVLLGGLEGIIALLDVSRHAYYRIVFNFVWSAVYNVFAILLAAGAFVKIRIPPSYAGLGEIVSVMPVVLAAMSMMKVKIGKR